MKSNKNKDTKKKDTKKIQKNSRSKNNEFRNKETKNNSFGKHYFDSFYDYIKFNNISERNVKKITSINKDLSKLKIRIILSIILAMGFLIPFLPLISLILLLFSFKKLKKINLQIDQFRSQPEIFVLIDSKSIYNFLTIAFIAVIISTIFNLTFLYFAFKLFSIINPIKMNSYYKQMINQTPENVKCNDSLCYVVFTSMAKNNTNYFNYLKDNNVCLNIKLKNKLDLVNYFSCILIYSKYINHSACELLNITDEIKNNKLKLDKSFNINDNINLCYANALNNQTYCNYIKNTYLKEKCIKEITKEVIV